MVAQHDEDGLAVALASRRVGFLAHPTNVD
jgi:hypothetical protein